MIGSSYRLTVLISFDRTLTILCVQDHSARSQTKSDLGDIEQFRQSRGCRLAAVYRGRLGAVNVGDLICRL